MLEGTSFSVSTTVIGRAIGLLDDVLDAIDDRAHWCKGAFAVDADGRPLEGVDVVEVVERPEVAARCVFGHALHLARRRRWRVELAVAPESPPMLELRRAPNSFSLAALALAEGALGLVDRRDLWAGVPEPEPKAEPERPKLARLLLASVVANDLPATTHEDAVWMVVYAIEWLRMLLDQPDGKGRER